MDQDTERGPGLSSPPSLGDLEAINNLDTARMALRWALERLHVLQKNNEELERKAATETAARAQAESDRRDLQRVIELRGQEDAQRQAYYAKLESYLSQHFSGKLDLAALIKREVQTSELESLLNARQIHLEAEFSSRREKLEAEFKRLKFEAEQAANGQSERAQAAALASRKIHEREFAVKLAELAEKEVRLRADEEALVQRQAHFDSFCREQRARLELDIQTVRDSFEEQAAYRVQSAQTFLSSRNDAAAQTWQREKTALLKEIDEWREKALAYLPRYCELERKLMASEEAAHGARCEAERQVQQLQTHIRDLEAQRAVFAQELTQLRQSREADLPRRLELERSISESVETCTRLSAGLSEANARLGRLQEEATQKDAACRAHKERMEAEKDRILQACSHRMADLDALDSLLSSRFQDLEEEIHQRDKSWKEREELLRRRDRDWHTRLAEWQAELTGKAEQIETLRSNLIETIRSYKARMGMEPGTKT
ncbi:MAG TPA: hypothetical protein DCP85_00810 [Elusimicrobia bacterium]|nr:hypothetical protein [Elusimicrobiota bacterium]